MERALGYVNLICPLVWFQYALEYVERQRPRCSLREFFFSTDFGAYGSHTIGHSVGPLVVKPVTDKQYFGYYINNVEIADFPKYFDVIPYLTSYLQIRSRPDMAFR